MAVRAKIEKTVVECVNCGDSMILSMQVALGDLINCPECGTTMQVISEEPIEVDWVYDEPVYTELEDEDW